MEAARVSVGIVVYSYGGNGGIASMSPLLGEWLCRLFATLAADPRISYAGSLERDGRAFSTYSDTPITMTRNRTIEDAKRGGFDFVLMLDNDNEPDGYWNPTGPNSADVKPFWDTSFDFAYRRLICGLPTVVVAPYCGPPPKPVTEPGWIDGGEVPYLFQWSNNESDNPHAHQKLSMLTRNEAARLAGMHPVAAAPTGVSLWALSVFDGMKQPHFYYEYSDDSQAHKVSTEDVTATRDVSLFWQITKGEEVLFANCDAWAFHCKTKHVGRPTFTPIETVGKDFAEAIRQNWSGKDRLRHLTSDTPRAGQVLGSDQNQVIISDEFIAQRLKEDAEREAAAKGEKPAPVATPEQIAELTESVKEAFSDEPTDPPKSNGVFTRDRSIGGRLVKTVGRELPIEAIQSIENLAVWCVNERDGVALDVAVVHSDTGQSAAAILQCLADGSHLYCLDNLGAREHGAEKSAAFADAFRAELETGRVMSDIEGRNFPLPHQPAELDIVFIERYITRDWLEVWQRHLKPNGVLAGFANSASEQQIVRDYAEENGYVVNIDQDVFAIPLEMPSHV